MPVRAVLFDYGHTLVDFHRTEEALLDAYQRVRDLVVEVVEEEDPVPDADRLVRHLAQGIDELVEASYVESRLEELDIVGLFTDLLAAIGFTLPDDIVRRIVALDHLAYRSCITVPDGTITTLRELRAQGYRLGFVSNAHLLPDLLRADLDLLGLTELLDGGVFSCEIGRRKPDAAIFRHVLDQLGVPPADAVHVGDRVRDDIGGAVGAGLRGGILTHQWRQEEPDGREVGVVQDLREIVGVVDGLRA